MVGVGVGSVGGLREPLSIRRTFSILFKVGSAEAVLTLGRWFHSVVVRQCISVCVNMLRMV